jgi:hypothetical protein
VTTVPARFTKANPCPVCGGHDGLGRGQGVRCFGYYDGTARYARCTRPEKAGSLPQNNDGTYSHWLGGRCHCGHIHGDTSMPMAKGRYASGTTVGQRGRQSFRSYYTLAAFLRRRYGEGTVITDWIYHDRSGGEILRVLRIDYAGPDGSKAKTYRPCHLTDDGRWRLGRPDGPLPLYRLPSLLAGPADGVVAVLEGEKCADIAAGLGLPSTTTSAHGAQAPQLTDWSPLAGRIVTIVRDEGERGAEYAGKVAALLAALNPPAVVRTVRLPGLCDGDDIEQWLAAQRSGGRMDSEILVDLTSLIETSR